MDYKEINQTVKDFIMQINEEQELGISEVQDDDSLVEDLGFSSLYVASLVAFLENKLEVDPFSTNRAVITEMRTVEDIAKAYEKSLNTS
ncbi:MAG: acyl carrier protein [Kiritimatiellae bacterium]|nr:acyl carrier protein [Kiritimatiellia bacterium]